MEFLYKIEKEEKEENIEIRLFYINKKQKKIIKNKKIPYIILVEKEKFKFNKFKSNKIKKNNIILHTKDNLEIIKLEIQNKELFQFISEEFKSNNIKMFEADLPIEHRFLIDNNIPIINKRDEQIPSLKYLSLDIETIGEKENQEIIMISTNSINNPKLNKVYISKNKIKENQLKLLKKHKFKDFKVQIYNNEEELLKKFKDEIQKANIEVIIGWNVIDFDFKVIKDRMNKFNIKFNLSKSKNNCKLRIIPDFFRDSSLDCQGILIFDMIQILKSNYIIFEDYKLDTVAKKVLDDTKINLKDTKIIKNVDSKENNIENKLKEIENMFNKNIIKLIKYNFKDSLLVSKITEKLGLLKLMQERSAITQTPLSKVKSPIATLDIMYLKELHKKKLVANSNFNFKNSIQIEGAYVIEPKKGFYKDIFVFDFKSLYPSIIMTFNIDPYTIEYENQKNYFINNNEKYDNKPIIAPNNAKFAREPGILPNIIKQIYKQRDIAKKEKNEIKSYALKITMNSFYGAMASPKSRFYNRDVGSAITSFGREILHKAKLFVEKRGDNVIYGDTDSIFVRINGMDAKSLDDKKKIGLELEKKLNEYFSNWVKEKFNLKSYLTIEMEKIFSKFFIASKKRYVGFDLISNKKKFVGMEAIRGDWTPLAKEFQKELVNLIFNNSSKEKIKNFILEKVNNLKKGKFDDKLIYSKKITKPLAEYTKTTPPHVKAARELKNFNGRVVKYIITTDGPKHINIIENLKKQNRTINYDYNHYIEKQLKGVADDLLGTIGIDFDTVLYLKKQKSLNGFFN